MPTFEKDCCYSLAATYAACIEFRLDEHHRRAFNASQLIEFSLDPNPAAGDDKDAPPQKLSIVFSTADVVILGWRLGLIADYLRDNKLSVVAILPKRYAELGQATVFVSAIIVTSVDKI